jgi:hypothetical protein
VLEVYVDVPPRDFENVVSEVQRKRGFSQANETGHNVTEMENPKDDMWKYRCLYHHECGTFEVRFWKEPAVIKSPIKKKKSSIPNI